MSQVDLSTKRKNANKNHPACPSARALWKGLAKEMDWPDLAAQQWGSIVSGTKDVENIRGSKKKLSRKRCVNEQGCPVITYWMVPWSLVRLISLLVLMVLVFDRNREIKSGKKKEVMRSIKFVMSKLKSLINYEKDKMYDGLDFGHGCKGQRHLT